MERFVSLPFAIDEGTTGGVAFSHSLAQKYKQFISCVLLTNLQERVMRPNYGSSLSNSVFDFSYGPSLEQQVTEALGTWVPNVVVQSLAVTEEDYNPVITIDYALPDGTTDSLTVQQTTIGDVVRFAVKTEEVASGSYVNRVALPTGQVLYE